MFTLSDQDLNSGDKDCICCHSLHIYQQVLVSEHALLFVSTHVLFYRNFYLNPELFGWPQMFIVLIEVIDKTVIIIVICYCNLKHSDSKPTKRSILVGKTSGKQE